MAINKFNRNYIFTFQRQIPYLPLVVKPPFTIEFDITRTMLTSTNVAQFRIYNLSEGNRASIRYNNFGFYNYQPIVMQAGYGTSLSTIFSGNVTQAWSVREGVNFISQLECLDGGFAYVNDDVNVNVLPGYTYGQIIYELISAIPNITVGIIDPIYYQSMVPKGRTFSGSATDILYQITGGGFFVDNGKGNALGTTGTIPIINEPLFISPESGLIGTPIRQTNIIEFEMLFEPNLTIGSAIQFQSETEENYNGFYKIISVKHRGMISPTVCGSAITTGSFFLNQPLDL